MTPYSLSKKLSPEAKRLLLSPPKGERTVRIMLRISGSLNEPKKRQLEESGCRLHTISGDVISAEVGLERLLDLCQYEFVLSIELSGNLFPEKGIED